MRKLFFILLCLFTCYLAGMYRYLPLMVLAQLELVFFVVSFFVACYFRKSLSMEVLRHSDSVEKSMQYICSVRMVNKGKLPVNSFRVRLVYGYGHEPRMALRHIYGGCECGENLLQFEISGQYCGMIHLKMNRLRVYDYLSLFSASVKLNEEIWIAVFPQEKALSIALASLCFQESNLPREQVVGQGEEAHNEIRQFREYRTGDSKRYIHWNQSARMGQLWVKEYERETDYRIRLFLRLENMGKTKASVLDCFYELLSAVLLGLLGKAAAVRVSWYDGGQKSFVHTEVADAKQCREILLMLYRTQWTEWDEEDRKALTGELIQGAFELDLDLCWYWNGSLIFQFSEDELEDQIIHKSFVV